ncbi:MAG: GvpL/GvpF family gas vesicle protein [Gemmatimonadaceae bacterium]
MAVRLYGITQAEDHAGDALPGGVHTVRFRDLVAAVGDAPYAPAPASDATIAAHREVVEALFDGRTLLPAPPGVTFRTPQALQRWMELHYVALSDALSYVDDRAAARVHIMRGDSSPSAPDSGTDLATTAAECMRTLRRQAVAGLPLRTEHLTGIVLSSAFLVERELWKDFAGAVRRVAAEHSGFRVELTGPWPPYDFVRMDFGD